ncbi:MAG TPA: aminopeptidase [Caldisericia bacterium]|nr:aminopeptidase [Caldisericia bacterium]
MSKEKSVAEEKREQLFFQKKNVWSTSNDSSIQSFAKEYKDILDVGKTERIFVRKMKDLLLSGGFEELTNQTPLKGKKYFRVVNEKGIFAYVPGKQPISSGVNFIATHIDSPRLDVKPNPLYEDSGIAFLDTHYYGGIKTYQWMNIALSLHGVVTKTNGEVIEIHVGEREEDPVFMISDILPHLAKNYKSKPVGEVFNNENLDVIVGTLPFQLNADEKDSIKLFVMDYLHQEYGITEKDFFSAELEFVPACKARDIGFDRGLMAGYGHDDRCCSYPAMRALMDTKTPEKAAITLLFDKEEIGSVGTTGAMTHLMEVFIEDLMKQENNSVSLHKVLSLSVCLSGDVGAALDPHFKDVFESKNAAELHKGVILTKYTGSGGKGGANDAHSEFLGSVRSVFEKKDIAYQVAELGKVDVGGGGTVAGYFGNRGIQTVDVGIPVLSMHSPQEIIAKDDLYELYRAYKGFFEEYK